MTLQNRNPILVAAGIIIVGTASAAYWLHGDRADSSSTSPPAETATGNEKTTALPGTTALSRAKTVKKPLSTRVVVNSQPLPPPNAPLAQVYADLKKRAGAGDAPAASRLYHDVGRCLHTRDVLTNQTRTASWMLEDDTSKLDADQLSRREKRLESIEGELTKAHANSELCDGLTPAQLQLAPVALRAAQLGDTQAADCYVSSGLTAGGGLLDHPEWLQDYKDNALTLANNAIQQGDWTMVSQLQRAYAQSPGAGLLGQVTGSDPSQAYAYLKLRSLGAVTPQGTTFLSRQLADAAQNLPADAVTQGDTWAQTTYQQSFGANPQINTPRNFNPCQNIGG